MSLRLEPPFRAEHIGSLIRPTELFHKRRQFEANAISAQELRVAEENAIKHVVKLQKDLGLRTITDGEMTRSIPQLSVHLLLTHDPRGMFFEGVFETLQGIKVIPNRPMSEFKVALAISCLCYD
jgi:hypothetical protein